MAQAGDRVTHIKVTNHNSFVIMDRYDGIQYAFYPERPLNIPAEVASHIFGYAEDATEEDMLKHMQRRFGWNTPKHLQDETYLMYFDNIDIKPQMFKLVEVEVGAEDPPEPAPAPKLAAPKGIKPAKKRGRPPLNKKPDPEPEDDEPEADAPAESSDVAA